MKDTIRLNFDFPREHYPYLKMLCAKEGTSLRQYASQILIQSIEDYEDRILAERAEKRLDEMDDSDLVDFHEAIQMAGWNENE